MSEGQEEEPREMPEEWRRIVRDAARAAREEYEAEEAAKNKGCKKKTTSIVVGGGFIFVLSCWVGGILLRKAIDMILRR